MSRIYVDRISPYQSGSVQVDGLSIDTGSLVTTASFNAYTASAPTLGSNTFSGTQTFTGSIEITGSINADAVAGSNTFNQNAATFNVGAGNQKFHIVGPNYKAYTSGVSWQVANIPFTEGIMIGNTYGMNFFNSSFTKDCGFSINMNTSAGTGTNKIGIWGAGSGGYYDFISFEDVTNWTDGRIEVHRTLQVDEVLQLQAQNPLPSGQLGQLAVSGSDLYFHNGTNWVVK